MKLNELHLEIPIISCETIKNEEALVKHFFLHSRTVHLVYDRWFGLKLGHKVHIWVSGLRVRLEALQNWWKNERIGGITFIWRSMEVDGVGPAKSHPNFCIHKPTVACLKGDSHGIPSPFYCPSKLKLYVC